PGRVRYAHDNAPRLAELAAATSPGFALGLADGAGGPGPGRAGVGPGAAGQATAGYVAAGHGAAGHGAPGQAGQDPVGVAAEWAVPSRMTSSTAALLREDPVRRKQRQRAAALAVGAAVVTGTALGALLLSGALQGSPAAHPTQAGSTSASATKAHPRPSA